MSVRTWVIACSAGAALLVFALAARSCARANRPYTAEAWIRLYVTAPESPTLKRNNFFHQLQRFDRREAAAALVDAIGRDEEAYRAKRFGLTIALARLDEPSALDAVLALHARLDARDRRVLAFAIGACLTRENVDAFLAACGQDASLLAALPPLTDGKDRTLDEWRDYLAEEGAVEKVRAFCLDYAARAIGSS